jgi:hypothetical protein
MPRSSSAPASLRALTARGGALNAAFLSGAEALVLLQGLLATALLGPDAIGRYGIVTTTAMTIVASWRVWSLVIGPFCGNAAAVLAAARVSPYALRPVVEREALRRSARSSWPVFVTSPAALGAHAGVR